MKFTKMHGLSNDYIYADGFTQALPGDLAAVSIKLSKYHTGIGADGLILIEPAENADARMRIFNSDGSEPEMCGNGIRCAAKFLRDAGLAGEKMKIETLAGVLTIEMNGDDCTVDMGRPCMDPKRIPVAAADNRVILDVGGRSLRFFCVSMGNPHAVTFDFYPDDEEFLRLGPALESHPVFPAKANIEFCRVRDGEIDVRVWERGDGPTLACGTGACATLTAAASQGLTGRESRVNLPGGALSIRWAENGHLFMTGPAKTVFVGEWPL